MWPAAPGQRAAAYGKAIAEAVHYAHQHGILHRDLKPSNVARPVGPAGKVWRWCRRKPLVAGLTTDQYPDVVRAVAISRDGKLLALGAGGEVALWDLTTKRTLTVLPIAAGRGLAFSPSGSPLALASRGGRGGPGVDLWDVNAGKLTATLTHPSPVRCLAFSPDGTLLATFDDKGTIALVEWVSNQTLTNFSVLPPRRGQAGVVVFSPEGSRLAIGEDYGKIRVLNWRTGAVVPSGRQS